MALICPYAASNLCSVYETWLKREKRKKRVDIISGVDREHYCIALTDLRGGGFPSKKDVGIFNEDSKCSHIDLLNRLESK